MNPYYNLPPEQRFTQRQADQFNADEQLWQRLALNRILRRFLQPTESKQKLKKAGLDEFAQARPPQYCIGTTYESHDYYCSGYFASDRVQQDTK